MKIKVLLIGIMLLGLVSCKGSSSKKVIDVGKSIYKAYKEIPAPARNKLNGIIRSEVTNQFAPGQVQCPACGGYGILFLVDDFGYPIYDYNGQIQTCLCSNCSGQGFIVV